MSNVRNLDGSPFNQGPVEEKAVCERASFQYCRNPNPTWPFTFSFKDNRWYVARHKRRSQYEAAKDVGEALL